jgi:hypothetical protein
MTARDGIGMEFNGSSGSHAHVEDPPFARLLFASTKMAWFWLAVRLYVRYAWVDAGLHKVQDPKWAFGDGSAMLGFWQRAAGSAFEAPNANTALL